MKKNSLVERAKKLQVRGYLKESKKFTKEEIGLALAWASGEIALSQVNYILGNSSVSYIFLATALREYVRVHRPRDNTK